MVGKNVSFNPVMATRGAKGNDEMGKINFLFMYIGAKNVSRPMATTMKNHP